MAHDKTELVEILRKMILIREFDLLAIELRKAKKIYGALHPYVGEEAVAVGVCAALRPTDRITSTHRGHGHCIAKGADINRMMAELFGRADGYCKGKGGSMHIADFAIGMLGANGIVAGGMPIACGAALAAQMEDRGGVAACFFGDGATGEGEFHESAQHRLALEAAPALRLREQPLRRRQRRRVGPGRHRTSRCTRPRTGCPASRSTATTSSPSARPPSRRSSGRGAAPARR